MESTHLVSRDRLALGFRIAGALAGFAVILTAFVTSSWEDHRVVALITVVIAGGAVAYHLLTSVVPCPSCGKSVFNFGIGPPDVKRKLFTCGRCGTSAWIGEGFYWQSDING